MKNQNSDGHNLPSRIGRTLPVWLCFIILHSSFCLRVWGEYAIDWSTIDGGGVYSVSGIPHCGTSTMPAGR